MMPKIEKTTRLPAQAGNIVLLHFCFMFGYKLFSLYFPLFLVEKNFSLPQVGYSTFAIYLPIALAAPLVGFFNYKWNSATLASLGILGYGIYCLGMVSFPNLWVFYLLQMILGISAALFFVSTRVVLMSSISGESLPALPTGQAGGRQANRAFAWFYTAPTYAAAIAPVVGALIIWKFGFEGVFIVSFCIQLLLAGFCFVALRKSISHRPEVVSVSQSTQNYKTVLDQIRSRKVLPFIFLAFLLLVFDNGFAGTFFVLFLKNLGWSRNTILLFNALLSLAFLPISFLVIKAISRISSQNNIRAGTAITGTFYIALGAFAGALNFAWIFLIMMGDSIGALMAGSGRSGLMTTKLKKYPKESAAIDTMFSPFSTAVGGLIGGLAIATFGYSAIFIAGGFIIVSAGLLIRKRSNT